MRGLRKLHGEGYEVSLKAIFAAITVGGGIAFVVQCAATHRCLASGGKHGFKADKRRHHVPHRN
jgi:hypothetical protein